MEGYHSVIDLVRSGLEEVDILQAQGRGRKHEDYRGEIVPPVV